MTAPRQLKILFTGAMGVGKTTAIASVSDVAAVQTEAGNSDLAPHSKTHSAVAMDYGEVQLAGGDRLRLYGIPGQKRFNVMWQILGRGALGVVILVDLTRPDPVSDLREYLRDFSEIIRESSGVIGVAKGGEGEVVINAELAAACLEMGFMLPIFAVDFRQREDVMLLLDALFSQIQLAGPKFAFSVAEK